MFNFEAAQSLAGYLGFTRVVNLNSEKAVNRDTWANGNTIFAFDIGGTFDRYFNPAPLQGSARLEVTFAKAAKSDLPHIRHLY